MGDFELNFVVVDDFELNQTLHQLKLTQDTSTYTLQNSVVRKYSIVVDCGAALENDATLPL